MMVEIDMTNSAVRPGLYHDSSRGLKPIAGEAHIVLSILPGDSGFLLQAFRRGEFNAIYANSSDGVVAQIAPLLKELRAELAAEKT